MMFTFRTRGCPQEQTSRLSSSLPAPSSEPSPKRAKIPIACNVCKAMKIKCDGAHPVCGPCVKRKRRSQPCVYRETLNSVLASSHEQPRRKNELRDTTIPIDNQHRQPSGVLPSGGFFGASSGAHALQGMEAGHGSTSAFEKTKGSRCLFQPQPLKELPRLGRRKPTSQSQFLVPPRKQADHLLGLYWDFVESAYPWLDRFSIESAYATLWSQDEKTCSMDERALHCILNLMFATSCVASQGESPLSRYQSSVVFFDRAQQLMTYDLMEMYNFEIIQILLLTAVYLQHDKEPQKCFRSIGMAIHIAQELGLHLPETTETITNPRERDLARQVWNGCVIMDRISSMTFGCALKVPQSLAEQGLNAMTVRSAENTALPSKVNFYISFCRLHYIIGEVLETFYNSSDHEPEPSASSKNFDRIANLLQIESQLDAWAANLHPFFQKPVDAEDSTPTKHITREANILRARYLSVRLLLLRPFLLQSHQNISGTTASGSLYTDEQILPHVVVLSKLNCARAAADMIEFIARNSPEQTQAYILPSNWYTVSYVYMAVTTLLTCKMCRQIMEHFSATHLNSLLHLARNILRNYEVHTTLASRCSSVIKLIDDNVDKGGIETDSGRPALAQSQVNEGMVMQGASDSGAYGTQDVAGNFPWVDNYAFDWNDWPTFFAQLDGGTGPLEGW
ncbi:fungal-specific transcription factor domain-containing protein [Aspergillus venezuelensis]